MIPDTQLSEIRQALRDSARPLVFFDDDPDGLCSFLQFYKFNPECKGVIYKLAGPLDSTFLKKVEEYQPDAIFILDVAVVTQDFLDNVKNVYWIDHHAPLALKGVKYYNPMIESKGLDNRPISYWAARITGSSNWLAMCGCVGDWFLPEDLRKEFEKDYPDLLPSDVKRPEDALFQTGLGRLSRMISFVLKGSTKDSLTNTKVMTRIKSPYEILEQSTESGRFIYKKFMKTNETYKQLKESVKTDGSNLLVFTYTDNRTSLTSDLSNELLYQNPDSFIVIARKGNSEYKISLRSAKYKVLDILTKALEGVRGYGGGHVHACGANVPHDDFERFIENIRKQL
jgi:nanoRNase/pAp phosphatase (c-di-AMP/oligoRNAs hydrolase)